MDKKKIEIVPGDGNINISPAEDNINDMNKTNKKPKKEDIVIPKTKED